MEFIKKNIIVIIAFLLPLLLIFGIAISSYLPSLFLRTQYNFVYATCGNNNGYSNYRSDCENYLNSIYSVRNGKLVIVPINPSQDSDKDGVPDINENYVTRLFLHNTRQNISREITNEEAQTLSMSGLITSPDGVSVSNSYTRNADFFPFFGGSSEYGYYLTKGKNQQKLNLISENSSYYYHNNFKFIGWVL